MHKKPKLTVSGRYSMPRKIRPETPLLLMGKESTRDVTSISSQHTYNAKRIMALRQLYLGRRAAYFAPASHWRRFWEHLRKKNESLVCYSSPKPWKIKISSSSSSSSSSFCDFRKRWNLGLQHRGLPSSEARLSAARKSSIGEIEMLCLILSFFTNMNAGRETKSYGRGAPEADGRGSRALGQSCRQPTYSFPRNDEILPNNSDGLTFPPGKKTIQMHHLSPAQALLNMHSSLAILGL